MVIGKCTDIFREIFWVGGGGLRGGVTWGDPSMEEFFLGEENFHEGGAGFSIIIKKKQWKNIYEKVFSTESKEQH